MVQNTGEKQTNKKRDKALFWICCFFLMFAAIGLANISIPLKGKILTLGDGTSSVFIPYYFGQQFFEGHLPLWSHETSVGVPIGSYMLGAFFLPSILFSKLPFAWYVWLNYSFFPAFGACFFGMFLEEKGVKRRISALMGFAMLFSVYYGGFRVNHVAIIQSVSVIPFVFYEFQCYLNTRKRSSIVLAGLGAGTILLIATPSIQYGMYTLLVLFVYVLVESLRKKVKIGTLIIDALLFITVTLGAAAVQIMPGYALMHNYVEMSTNVKVPFDTYFKAYSISPVKLIMMFAPNVFNDVNQTFGYMNSSEIDIELFSGTLITAISIFGVIRLWKDKSVRLLFWLALGVFIYAAHGHIPFLSDILYRVPFLNNIRCSGRALYLFVFLYMTIAAITLSRLSSDKENLGKFRKFLCYYTPCVAILLLILYLSPIGKKGIEAGVINADFGFVFYCAVGALTALTVLVIILDVAFKGDSAETKRKRFTSLLAMAIIVTSIGEMIPYSTGNHSGYSKSVLKINSIFPRMKEIDPNSSIITTYDSYEFTAKEAQSFSSNRQFYTELPCVNSYLTFNNPNLYYIFGGNRDVDFVYYNYSGLYTGFEKINDLLKYNDILSMLGIRYIEDTNDVFDSDFVAVEKDKIKEKIFNAPSHDFSKSQGEYSELDIPVKAEPDSYYRVEFEATVKEAPMYFFADLYAQNDGVEFDDDEYQINFELEPGTHRYSGYIHTGGEPLPDNTFIRIIAINFKSDINISNIHVNRVSTTGKMYPALKKKNGKKYKAYYVNKNAKDLFYSVEKLEGISDNEEIIRNPDAFHYLTTAYVENVSDRDFTGSEVTISDIEWVSNHEARAVVDSTDAAFINFAQSYDPDWHVYIDGKETENYQSNLVIQGFITEPGRHVITYKYKPKFVYAGLVISLITWIGCLVLVFADRIIILAKSKKKKTG